MPVLETEGRVASRSEAENALVPVMYRQHALSADRSHIATPMNATRMLRRAIFAYGAPAGLITICSMHMQDRGAVAERRGRCSRSMTATCWRSMTAPGPSGEFSHHSTSAPTAPDLLPLDGDI